MLISSIFTGCGDSQKTSDTSNTSPSVSDNAKPSDDVKPSEATSEGKKLKKVTVSYAGGTCEAPEYVAYHKGFFKEEGLEVDFVKADFNELKTGIASGKIDASVGNFSWFKAIEQGLKVKLTAGLHAGCIQAVAPESSGIKSLKDLKGKTVGVDAIGGGPHIILSIELKKLGIDPKTDVQWKAFPPPQLETATEKKDIDAFIVWDPFGEKALKEKKYVKLLNIGHDEPYKSGYCCYVVVSEKLVKEDPETAAAYTRAILKADEWIGSNQKETAQLEVDNKYVSADVNDIEKLLKDYVWKPSVKKAKENVKFFIDEQKKQGILEASTDENQLFEKIFAEVIPDYKGE
jgi:NitT/TauT family transport system substrate-binding protein